MIASWKGRKNLIDLLSLFLCVCVCACGGAPVFFSICFFSRPLMMMLFIFSRALWFRLTTPMATIKEVGHSRMCRRLCVPLLAETNGRKVEEEERRKRRIFCFHRDKGRFVLLLPSLDFWEENQKTIEFFTQFLDNQSTSDSRNFSATLVWLFVGNEQVISFPCYICIFDNDLSQPLLQKKLLFPFFFNSLTSVFSLFLDGRVPPHPRDRIYNFFSFI